MVGYEGTWQRVMNTALERMVRDIASDRGYSRRCVTAAPRRRPPGSRKVLR